MVLKIMRGKKFSRRVLGGLLVIIIPAFVFWGVGSISDRPKPAGKISGRSISAEDFSSSRQGVQAQIMLNFFSDYNRMSSLLKDQTLMNTMAWERLLLLLSAKDKKIKVSNREVMLYISSHPLFQREGVFNRSIYIAVLGNPSLSLSPRKFEELTRENLLVIKFRNTLLSNISVSNEEIVEKFSEYGNKVVFSYFLVNKDNYFESIEITDREILDAYERNKDRLYSKERAEVEYIEVPYSSAEEKNRIAPELKKTAVEISGNGISFEESAGKLNYKYGKTEFFTADDALTEMEWFKGFNDVAFALKDGEVSYPVFSETDKGSAFIIKKTGTELPELLPFEKVKAEITLALKNVKSVEKAKAAADELFESISSSKMTFEDAASSIEASVSQTPLLSSVDYIGEVTSARELVIAALASQDEPFLPPFITHKGVLLTRIDEIYKAPSEELTEEVREALKQNIISRKQATAVNDWLKQHSADIETSKPLEKM